VNNTQRSYISKSEIYTYEVSISQKLIRPDGCTSELEQQLQSLLKLGQECNMSVRLHFPEVFDDSLVMDLIILMIGLKASVISNKDLIGRSGWPGMQTRDILQSG
jgi:hypothetical protein